MYVGSNLETTRDFCDHLTEKKYIHESELPDIVAGKIDGYQCPLNPKTKLWAGAIAGTTVDNFIVYRGGWNCGHQLMPVNEAAVPENIRNKFKIQPVMGKDFTPEQVENNKEISKTLVLAQGEPMDFDTADKRRGNVNYLNGGQYQNNCQCCVVAYELRRRGFDVTALGNPNKKGTVAYKLSEYPAEIWIDPTKNRVPKMDYLPSTDGKSLLKDLNAYTQDEGRYHFVYTPKGKQMKHIITIEKLGENKFQIYDPQDGKKYVEKDFLKDIRFNKNIEIYRVDNLIVNNEKISEVVTNRQ
jgi:hypothetical protein